MLSARCVKMVTKKGMNQMRTRLLPTLLLSISAILCACSGLFAEDSAAGNSGDATKKSAADLNTAPQNSRIELWKDKVVVIPLKGAIAPESMGGTEEMVVAAIKDAAKAKLIIMEIDSPGGAISSCDAICGALLQSKAPAYALVLRKAVSGGAMVATACKRIYMLKGSRIGDIQPMSMIPQEMDDRTIEKIESDVRAIMAANASANGYPVELLESMVSRTLQIYEVKSSGTDGKNGRREFLKQEQYDLLKKNMEEGIDTRTFAEPPRVVVETGKILSLSAQDAEYYGLATAVLPDENTFWKTLKLDPAQIVRVDLPEGELSILKSLGLNNLKLSRWLLFLLIICLAAGVGGALAEFHLPGFGIPGTISVIGFSSFFYILAMHDRASPFEIALFITGIGLLMVEIIVLPGFGVTGIIGGCCLFVGLGLALLPDFNSPYMQEHFWSELTLASGFTLSALIISLCIFIFVFERGGQIPFLKGIFLPDELPSGRAVIDNARATPVTDSEYNPDERMVYLGKFGVAATTLRPAGKMRLDSGEVIDVVTGGEFVEAGTKIRVSSVEMNRIVVVTT